MVAHPDTRLALEILACHVLRLGAVTAKKGADRERERGRSNNDSYLRISTGVKNRFSGG